MCLAVVALDAHPEYALVVAANRDEYHARGAAPAAWGREPPFVGVLAGRDLAAGGTWLGVRRDGRWALLTNVRDGLGNDPAAISRGELVPAALNDAAAPGMPLYGITDPRRYNGFNLIAGDAQAAVWMSNRSAGERRLSSGIHGLSNALLDTPWPKLVRTVDRLRSWAARGDADAAPLFAALADRTPAPDDALPNTGVTREWERLLSSPFIVSERYGTRCSTVFTIGRRGHARFVERSFAADGTPTGETIEEFRTQ
ncbi:MAG: NRDE family protein [Burkholderiales bacterium]|nr:NRDE family protein [Burkholderiales bacterium]